MGQLRRESQWVVLGALFIFALSGASGLIYQAIWSQYLGLFLGHAAYAQSLVLAIFMGGMALGAWWVSRYATNWRNLLRGYAYVELVIGIAAAIFHWEFGAVTSWAYDSVFPSLHAGALATTFKWSAATLLILPQAVLLGTTFPLMSNGIMRRSETGDGSILGGLYFSNSIGAAIGALTATFVLLPAVGLPGAMKVGAVINVIVALLAFLLSRPEEQHSSAEPVPASNAAAGNADARAAGIRLLLVAAFVTGASSFVYEIGWVRMLSLALGSTVHAFELMLAAFIGGLAFGGLWIRKRIDGYANTRRVGGYVQILMGLAALVSLLFYDHAFRWVEWCMLVLARTEEAYTAYNIVSALVAMVIMAPAAFFAGMTLPLFTLTLLRAGVGEAAVGRIYAANTVGAIAGVFLAVHVLIPGVGLKLAMIAAAVADLVLGVILLRPDTRQAPVPSVQLRPYFIALLISAIATALTLSFAKFDPIAMSSGVYRTGKARSVSDGTLIYYRDGKTASIAVLENEGGTRTIATNGKPDASISMSLQKPPTIDEITMIMAAVLPLGMHDKPSEIANIGFGSGLTTHTLLADPRVERVDSIEIEPAIIEGAKAYRPMVERAYTDPRAKVHIEDARSYFTAHNVKYDVIISEPSNPWVSGVASLFSREFYRFVPRHLKPKGLFVQWLQLYEINDELVSTVIMALQETFVDYRIYLSNFGDMILVASADGPVGDVDMTRLAGEDMRFMLYRVNLDKPGDMAAHEVGRRAGLESLIRTMTQRANSDFYPILSLEAPRSRFRATMATTLLGMSKADLPALELLAGTQLPDAEVNLNYGYTRSIYMVMASRLVAARGETDVPELESGLREKMAATRDLVGRCRSDINVSATLDTMRALAAESIPFLRPAALQGLWIAPDWISCSTQPDAVKAMLSMLEASAGREHASTLQRAEAILRDHAKALSGATADYVLRTAMLAASASQASAEVLRLAEEYKDIPPGNEVALEMRQWMVARALQKGTAPKQP
jgi:predicted membrane-bound spermidine synthase